MPKFCDRLKNLRKSANVTQGELAERMNVHPQTISKWERGITEPDVAQLGELAEALGISVERLLGCDEMGESYTGAFSARALGAMIYSLRSERGESQEQLGAIAGVSADAVSRWERGVTCPDIYGLRVLAEHFSMPVSKLYYGAEELPRGRAVVVSRGRLPVILLSTALAAVCIAAVLLILFLPRTPAADKLVTVMFDGKSVAVESDVPFTPERPERTGYYFVGWENEQGDLTDFPKVMTEGEEYTALFAPREYSIEYWLNGGYFVSSAPASINVENGAVQLPVPVKDGAQFVGWHISPDYSDECVQSVVCSAADITLYAEWSDRVYTVEYDLGGGMLYGENPSSVTVQGVVALASPVRLGYIFLGWYDSPSGGERYESVGGAGACNVTLYARWQQSDELFAISYGLDGGTAEGDNPVSVGAGEVHELFPAVKAGHEFLGWNTSPDGSGEYVQALYGVDGDMALYAVFSPKQYLIRYEYDGMYQSDAVNPNYITYGQTVELHPVYLTGHEFIGWYTSREGGERIAVIDESNILGISVLYARFEPLKYKITLDAAGGAYTVGEDEYSLHTFTVYYDGPFVLPECALGGYVFLGWADEEGERVEAIDKLNIRDMTLTAEWRESDKRYNITYVLDGGELQEPNPSSVPCGQTLPLADPVRSGYIFLGWYENPEGSGDRYSFTPADRESDLTLYAVWQEIKVSGSYDDFTYEIGVNGVTVTGYNGEQGLNVDMVIPAVIEGMSVTAIRGSSEQPAVSVRSLTIPEGIVSIGQYAFCNMTVEQTVVIPASVEKIEGYCFMLTHLKSGLRFAEGIGLKEIGQTAFAECEIRCTLVLPEGLEVIGRDAFRDADVNEICLPQTLKRIESGGLCIYNNLWENTDLQDRSLFIPESVEYLGYNSVVINKLYFAGGRQVLQNFSPKWFGGLDKYSKMSFNVEPVAVTLHVDGAVYKVLHGNYFALDDAEKDGYTFIGWKTAEGNYSRRGFATDEPLDLYASFEEQSATDGRTLQTAAVLDVNTVNTVRLRCTPSGIDCYYFRLDIDHAVDLVLEYNSPLFGSAGKVQLIYVKPDGEMVKGDIGMFDYNYSEYVQYEPGGYFIVTFDNCFVACDMQIYYSVL